MAEGYSSECPFFRAREGEARDPDQRESAARGAGVRETIRDFPHIINHNI